MIAMAIKQRAAKVTLHNAGLPCAGNRRAAGGLLGNKDGADMTLTVRTDEVLVEGSSEDGLKAHRTHAGWPAHRKFTIPMKALGFVIVTVKLADAPTARFAEFG